MGLGILQTFHEEQHGHDIVREKHSAEQTIFWIVNLILISEKVCHFQQYTIARMQKHS